MLLAKNPTLSNRIILLLSKTPALTAKDICSKINLFGDNYTLRGIYKELVRLEAEEIILRFKKTYSLRLTWLVDSMLFLEDTYSRYNTIQHLGSILPLEGKKTVIQFNNLRRLDLLWIQVMLALEKHYKKVDVFLWIPFQFFHLLHMQVLKQFFQAEEISGLKRFHIIGSDCYMNRLGATFIHKNSKVAFETDFFERKDIYYSLIGQYLLTIKVSKPFTKEIGSYYYKINNQKDFNKNESALVKLVTNNVACSITIENNTKNVAKISGVFNNYFN